MVIIFEIFLFFSFIFLFYLIFRITNRSNLRFEIKVTFFNLFLLALFLYTFLPLFDSYLSNKNLDIRLIFLIKSNLLLAYIFIGINIGKSFSINIKNFKKKALFNTRFWAFIFGLFCLFLLFLNFEINFGGLEQFLTLSYSSFVGIESNSILSFLLFSIFPYILIFNNRDLNSDILSRYIALFFTLIFIFLFLLGGRRNLALMGIVSLFFSKFYLKRVSLKFIFFGLIFGVIIMGLVAVFREFGVINVLSGNISLDWSLVFEYVSSISSGELSTMLNFERYQLNVVRDYMPPYSLGFSYFFGPVLSLIPLFFWPSRPLGMADHFSQFAFGNFDGFGYGFSPIYEAELNFGLLWGIVFVLIGFIYGINKKNRIINLYNIDVGLMSILVFNFFRIDFSTVFKFFFMMIVFKIFFVSFLRIKF